MMNRWVPLLVVVMLLSPISFFRVNAAPTIGSTTVTIYPVADAYVNSANSSANYGNDGYLYVGSNSEYNYTFIRFDLSSIPSGANVISATLEVYLSSKGGKIYGSPADTIGVYYCSDNSWAESSITWNNKPSFSSIPTDTWSFSIIYYVREYKSWDVTQDVKVALSSGNLTEVLKFESKTDYGYAVFHSREGTSKPKLEVEYATLPIFIVHLESVQDTGITTNIGLTTLTDYTFSLPTDVDVVAGSYQIRYSGGYMFMRWETSGGVSVSNPEAATTTVTVSGEGTLRAVGNAKRLEYAYDHETPLWETQKTGCIDAMRFTPLFSGQLLMARFYIQDLYSSGSNAFKVHVMDENRIDLITPFERTPTSKGWFDVDLSSYGISVNQGTVFYIGMEWIMDYNPDLGKDITDASDRSWHWNGTHWEEETYSDFMIRSVVGTLIDHVLVAESIVFHVSTESNSTVSNLQFIKGEKKLLFDVEGPTGTYGFCNVTIPNQLLGGPFNVTFNGQPVDDVSSFDNGTHTWLHFLYLQSEHTIEIVGTTAIPEFQPLLFSLLLIVMTGIAFTFRRKSRMQRKSESHFS